MNAFLTGQSPTLSGKRVLLLESGTISAPSVSAEQPYSNRVCALSLGSVEFLKRTCACVLLSKGCGLTRPYEPYNSA